MKGKFITFEGGEGSGKTTQISALKEWIEQHKQVNAITTREPGGTQGAEEIRAMLLKGDADKWDEVTEALMFSAARRDHLQRKIWPHLEHGEWVISDRFADSTVAYQGYGHGGDKKMLNDLYQVIAGDFKPDLTIILDIDPRVGIARTWSRTKDEGGDEDRMENIPMDFHDRLRDGYLELAKAEPDRFVVIDASQSVEAVREEIQSIMEKRF